jgi:hypothetical protein
VPLATYFTPAQINIQNGGRMMTQLKMIILNILAANHKGLPTHTSRAFGYLFHACRMKASKWRQNDDLKINFQHFWPLTTRTCRRTAAVPFYHACAMKNLKWRHNDDSA